MSELLEPTTARHRRGAGWPNRREIRLCCHVL